MTDIMESIFEAVQARCNHTVHHTAAYKEAVTRALTYEKRLKGYLTPEAFEIFEDYESSRADMEDCYYHTLFRIALEVGCSLGRLGN
ncbi:hypothetical protein D1159_04035 [Pseudoflavonifractor sp. 524-17]|uniref:DUF6809 family protein n=1 Tax=Pseudoflavonifractor sp. 524-17 TaxID=2304577 RepID=UPI001379A940|nr:DUF6809 family protein [Pseudoflavonifractor sp. 524-17]NCE63768.1 hypothetical protein [Pseudoflavonifractor sp. 524-17]